MKITVSMPQLGESITEGEVIQWLRNAGDSVERDEGLVEVKTDKATVEVPSPAAGTLAEIVTPAGEVVEVGATIATIETTSERAATSVEHPAPSARASAPAVELPTPEPPKPKAEPSKASQAAVSPEAGPSVKERPPEKERTERRGDAGTRRTAVSERSVSAEAAEREPTRMTPLARRLVKRHGLDPAKIEGTGANGRVTRGDVLKALEQAEEAAEQETEAKAEAQAEEKETEPKETAPRSAAAEEKPSVEIGDEDEAVALSPMRRRIAARLVHSKQTIPHVTTVVECDMTACAEARGKHKDAWEADGLKLSYMPFIMKATCDALQEFPAINSSWGGDKLIHHKRVHLAIAVAVEGGLAVPVIREADGMSMRELAKALTTVADHARKGKLTSEEVSGSTFTITNPGIFGAVFSTPIVNPPNAAILGTGRIAETPVVRDGEIVARRTMHLCLSYDHRIVDGETAIKFLGHMRDALERAEFEMG